MCVSWGQWGWSPSYTITSWTAICVLCVCHGDGTMGLNNNTKITRTHQLKYNPQYSQQSMTVDIDNGYPRGFRHFSAFIIELID